MHTSVNTQFCTDLRKFLNPIYLFIFVGEKKDTRNPRQSKLFYLFSEVQEYPVRFRPTRTRVTTQRLLQILQIFYFRHVVDNFALNCKHVRSQVDSLNKIKSALQLQDALFGLARQSMQTTKHANKFVCRSIRFVSFVRHVS